MLREKAEAHAGEIWTALYEAISAEAQDGTPDHRARYQAEAPNLAEAYGKTIQPTREEGNIEVLIEGRPPA